MEEPLKLIERSPETNAHQGEKAVASESREFSNIMNDRLTES